MLHKFESKNFIVNTCDQALAICLKVWFQTSTYLSCDQLAQWRISYENISVIRYSHHLFIFVEKSDASIAQNNSGPIIELACNAPDVVTFQHWNSLAIMIIVNLLCLPLS